MSPFPFRRVRFGIPLASSRGRLVWLLALVLPVFCAGISARIAFLRPVPMVLNFLAICLLAVLGGPWPAIFASLVAIAARIYFVVYYQRTPVLPLDLLRGGFLVVASIVVGAVLESRRRAQIESGTAIAALNDRTQALVDSLHAGKCASWVLDLDSGKSARWYKGSYQVFGRPFEELEARQSLADLVDDEDKPRFPALVQHMKTSQEPTVFEHRTTWPNGELHWLEMRATRVPGIGCIWRGVTVDITERKLAEATLLRQEKLAAMGRLASTVAHEINNPLEAVTNLLYLARTDPALSEDTGTYLATAEKELARLGDITRLTLGFVRNHSTRRSLRLQAVVEEVLAIFRHRYELKNIRIESRMDPKVSIEIAPHELRQILTNLISNAADALADPEPKVSIEIWSEDGNGVFVLEDNGTGIPEPALNRVFEPFFTTKADIGTGIGLWVTRELVEKNGGRISVESGDLADGMKTRFRVELPLAAETQVTVRGSEAVVAV